MFGFKKKRKEAEIVKESDLKLSMPQKPKIEEASDSFSENINSDLKSADYKSNQELIKKRFEFILKDNKEISNLGAGTLNANDLSSKSNVNLTNNILTNDVSKNNISNNSIKSNSADKEQKTAYELPDFSEDDLNFDIPIEKELLVQFEPQTNKLNDSLNKEEAFQESKEQLNDKEINEDLKENLQENLEDDELPMFETDGIIDSETLSQELKEFNIESEKLSKVKKENDSFTKLEVYIEKDQYLEIFNLKEEMLEEVNRIISYFNDINNFSNNEEKFFKEIIFEVSNIKDKILMLDSSIFEKG